MAHRKQMQKAEAHTENKPHGNHILHRLRNANQIRCTKKMTLYERLKPSLRDQLDDVRAEYPNIHDSLITALKENEFYVDLKYGDVISLQDFLGQPIYEMFNSQLYA